MLEDDEGVIGLIRKFFKQGVDFIFAKDLKEAKELFLQNKSNIDGVVVDGSLDSHSFDSLPFMKLIIEEENFIGPIVASSTRYNDKLLRAGATHAADDKREAVSVVILAIQMSSIKKKQASGQ